MRAVIVGIFQTTSDYFVKPLLSTIFNGFLQPIFTLVQNIFQSIFDMLNPVTRLMAALVSPFSDCVKNLRLFEVKNLTKNYHSKMTDLEVGENVN